MLQEGRQAGASNACAASRQAGRQGQAMLVSQTGSCVSGLTRHSKCSCTSFRLHCTTQDGHSRPHQA